MEKYVVYYKSNGKVIKEFISFRFALHFRESIDDWYKTNIMVKEIKENCFIYDDELSIVKCFNTLEEAKEYKMKHGNPYCWDIAYRKNQNI